LHPKKNIGETPFGGRFAHQESFWRYAHQTAPTGKPFGIHHVSRAGESARYSIRCLIPQFAQSGRSHGLAARRAKIALPIIIASYSHFRLHQNQLCVRKIQRV
jgi:hypothetical protein